MLARWKRSHRSPFLFKGIDFIYFQLLRTNSVRGSRLNICRRPISFDYYKGAIGRTYILVRAADQLEGGIIIKVIIYAN